MRSIVGGAETTLRRLAFIGTGGMVGTAGIFCTDRLRDPELRFGALLNVLSVGVRGDSESTKLSLRGDGGEDEHTEVAAVATSGSDVREVRVDVLE